MGKVAFFISQFKKIVNNVRQLVLTKLIFLQTKKWILLQAPPRNQPKCLERQRRKFRRLDHTRWRMTMSSVNYLDD